MMGGPADDVLTDAERAVVQELTRRKASEYELGFLDGVRHRVIHGSVDKMLILAATEHQDKAK